MQHILVLGGGAAGLAAALAAAQTAKGSARITVLDRNTKVGKKLLATGNGRCNLDNRDISPERYFTSSPKALRRLLDAVNEAAPLAWFEGLGLYPRTDEAGRVYPYSNQAADVLALLEHHLAALGVELRTGCTVRSLSQSRGGYDLQFETEAGRESLRADAVICAMGGEAGPQFGTDGFGTRFAAQCGGRMAPLYPCLTALQCARPRKSLAGIRAKGCASLLDGTDGRVLAREMGEVQFTDYGLSGICIMQLSGLLAPGRGPKQPVIALDLFPALSEAELSALFARRAGLLGGAAEFWLGLLPAKLGRALWADAGLPEDARALPASAWPKLAAAAKCWRFEGLTPLRLEAGPDDRRRTAAGRGGGRLPVQGLSGPLLRGRDAGLRGQLRRLQPPLGLRQRHPRRPVGGEAPPRPCPPEKEKDLKQHKTPEGISPGSCFLRYSFAAFSSSAASAAASASSSF